MKEDKGNESHRHSSVEGAKRAEIQRRSWSRWHGVLLMLFGMVGCAGQDMVAEAPPPASLAPEVAKLRWVVMPSAGGEVDAALQSALIRAGFAVQTSSAVAHDLEARATMTAVNQPQFVQVRVNGKLKVKQTVTIRVVVSGSTGVVDESTVQFTAEGALPDGALAPIASAFSRSPKFSTFAVAKQQQDEKAAQTQQVAEARRKSEQWAKENRERQNADEKAWIAAHVIACQEPRRADACDGVQKYLVDFPDGAHADEAKTAFEQAKPKLEKAQKDENAWLGSAPATCRSQHTKGACDAVDIYRTKFPAGIHIDEANALMEGL